MFYFMFRLLLLQHVPLDLLYSQLHRGNYNRRIPMYNIGATDAEIVVSSRMSRLYRSDAW